jgi:PAS domain S-box-containing protein
VAGESRRRAAAGRVALIYLTVSVVWILVTDQLLTAAAPGAGWLATAKGLLFVAVTAGAVYVLVGREIRAAGEHRDALRALAECSPDVVFAKDREGRYQLANPAALRAFGHPAEEVLGRSDADLLDPESAARLAEIDARVMATGRPETYEEAVPLAGGVRHFLTVKAPRRDAAGAVVGVVGIAHDVTERKQFEEQYRQAAKMETVGRLAGGVAHDFNNLLTVILGHADMLLAHVPAEGPVADMLHEVRRAGERAADLTHQLLAYSRRQAVAPRVLDLNDVVASAGRMLRRVLGEDVTLTTHPDPALPRVLADRGQVEQVLVNLAVNARDAMPRGGNLRIRTRAAGGGVVVEVSDSGCGMTAEVRARLFEPFFTTKPVGRGTGLGLAVVHGIVTQAGGRVEVASEPGRGATFTITLPPAGAADAAEADAHDPPNPCPWGTETVLVVEDEAAVLWLARRLLRASGYTVLAAADAAAAEAAADAHPGPIHLLLTDIVMPGRNGPDLARRLTADRPGMRVLFMSGYTDDAVVRNGLLHDQVDYLEKPFTPDQLLARVRAALDATPVAA